MRLIGDFKSKHAGVFKICYEENAVETRTSFVFFYHLAHETGRKRRYTLEAPKSFFRTAADAQGLMEAEGLVRLKGMLDSIDTNGFMTLPFNIAEGFQVNPVQEEQDT